MAWCAYTMQWVPEFARKPLGFPTRLKAPDDTSLAYIALSHDGSILAASGDNKPWDTRQLQGVTFWDARSLKVKAHWTAPISQDTNGWVLASALALSPDGKTVCFSRYNEPFAAYDVASQTRKWATSSIPPFSTAAFSNDGKLVGLASYDGHEQATYAIFNAKTGKKQCAWNAQLYEFQAAFAFAPDGRTLACVGEQRTTKEDRFPGESGRDIEIRRTSDGKRLQTIDCPWTSSLSFSPDGTQIVVLADALHPHEDFQLGEQVKCFDVATGKMKWKFGADKGDYWRQALFSPDGKTIAAYPCDRPHTDSSSFHSVQLLEAQTGTLRRTLRARTSGGIQVDSDALAFSPDSKRLFARGDNEVLVWDLE